MVADAVRHTTLTSAFCVDISDKPGQPRLSIAAEFQVADYLLAQEVFTWGYISENDLVGLAYQSQFGYNITILYFVQAPL